MHRRNGSQGQNGVALRVQFCVPECRGAEEILLIVSERVVDGLWLDVVAAAGNEDAGKQQHSLAAQ